MMQALTRFPSALLKAWIPIREKESPSLPFDISSERILMVDRENNVLDEVKFAEALRLRLNTLVESHKSNG